VQAQKEKKKKEEKKGGNKEGELHSLLARGSTVPHGM
jgi:hypothetical protein